MNWRYIPAACVVLGLAAVLWALSLWGGKPAMPGGDYPE
jgi:hypothetical protein